MKFVKVIKDFIANKKAIFNLAFSSYIASKNDSADMQNIVVGIVIALVAVVIGVELIPILLTATTNATSNATLVNNPHYTGAVSLIYIIPIVFVAGIVVVAMILMFGKE